MKRLRDYIGFGATRGSVATHLAVVLVISILAAFVFMGDDIAKSWSNLLLGIAWSAAIWFSQWMGNGYIIFLLDRRFPWMENPVKRLVIGFLSLITYSSVAIVVVQLLMESAFLGCWPDNWSAWMMHNIKTAVFISLFVSTFLSAMGFFRNWRTEAMRATELQNELISSEYALLRNQINPHFLFNSLNVLSELVYEDQATAVKFIRQLSDVYRYVIDSRSKDLVSLAEELEFIRSYVFLLNIRFGDKLVVNLPQTVDANLALIPMALQILLENAVKHNEVSTKNPLQISISVEGDCLKVRNNLAPKATPEERSGAGLENISKRYAYFSPKPIEINTDDGCYTVSIPLLQLE